MSTPAFTPPFTEFAPSVTRRGTQVGQDRNAVAARGVRLFFDVTDIPIGQLQVIVEAKDRVSGKYADYVTFPAITVAGMKVYTLFPGVVETISSDAHDVSGLPLPRCFRIKVKHSIELNDYVYSLGGEYLE